MIEQSNVLVSIVVPVYNVEQYIHRCVNSILSQTYSLIDVILVDDGSPDQCGSICDSYAKKDKRVRVIHKSNGGLSDARNAGTKIAKGKYITYVDSDDWIANTYVEVLLRALHEHGATMSICTLLRCNTEKVEKKVEYSVCCYKTEDALEKMLYQTAFDNSASGKMYPTELMRVNLFPVGKLFEDLFTIYKVLANCTLVAFVDMPLYYYWINQNGIMHTNFSSRVFDEIEAADEIVKFIEKNYPGIISAAYARKFSCYSQVYRWMPEEIDEELEKKKKDIWNFINKYKFKMILDNKARKKNRAGAVVACLGQKVYREFGR